MDACHCVQRYASVISENFAKLFDIISNIIDTTFVMVFIKKLKSYDTEYKA